MTLRSSTLGVLFLGLCAILIFSSSDNPEPAAFHTPDELAAFLHSRSPIDSGEYFLGSENCRGCHGFDTLRIGSVDADTNDVNLYDDWQSSMMAFSAKDPFWRAKVSHEILVNPGHSDVLQTKCTSCHAPMGHFSAMFKGAQRYTLSDLLIDTLGLNGVACGGCHQIASEDSIPLEFSGNIHYDTSHVEYGPFEDPLVGPMELYVGLIPKHSLHVSRSEVCAPCHTLQTKVVDLNGNYTGGYFTEQATFHEWLNSDFNSDQPCQSCHMPQLQDPIVIANNIQNLPPRSPFNLHKFMGGNTTMLKLIKENKTALDIHVPDANFDSTIVNSLELLQERTLDLTLQTDSVSDDTMFVSVKLKNKAGHKFPSGYPSRRAFISLAVINAGDTLFQSGILRPDYEVSGQAAAMEPHYQVISDSSQVQIYEMVMGDVNGNITTVLERAAITLKDNRIPPAGFRTTHSAYDTVAIVGSAFSDTDFNRNGANEGTGEDLVHYHISLKGMSGQFTVSAAVYYQVLPPRWLNEMFAYNSDFIDSFRNMYATADKTPVLIAHDTTSLFVQPSSSAHLSAENIRVYPIPSATGMVYVENTSASTITRIEVWTVGGVKVKELNTGKLKSVIPVLLPEAKGTYLLTLHTANGIQVKKVIRD